MGQTVIAKTDACEHEQRYRELFEYSHDGIFLLDVTRDGRFRIAGFNPSEEQLVGISSRRASGRYIEELFPADLASVLTANYRRCVAAARPISYEEELSLPGGRRAFKTTLIPVFDKEGRVHRIIGVARDITKERAATVELRASEERFRALAENIREVFWMIDATRSTILYVSPGYEATWGRTRQSLREAPRSWLDGVHPADRARVEAWLTRQRDGMIEITYRILRPDGSQRWIRDRSLPVRGEDGEITCFVGFADDITTVIQAEERLAQTQKLEALGRLAGGVAHDFNNMLSVILSYTGLLLGALEPGELREDAEAVRQAAESAAGLTRQLLAFSHQQALRPTVLELGQTVAGMKRMLEGILGEDIDLVLPETESECLIEADPGQIERVIMNLAVNARDAMPQGGRLTLGTANVKTYPARNAEHAGLEAGQYVELTVADTGTGMDTETRKRIFEPFFTTKEKGKGTGLGLATVFGIVEQSGGAIRVDSALGKGATFRVFFPRVEGDAGTRAMVTQSGEALRGTETILLTEDEPQVRAAARSVLRRCGYDVLEAENAGEALLICEQHRGRIDLLLTDVVMPRMSGSDLARRLAVLRPEMKVLYMSGHAYESLSRHGVPATGVAVFQKPITPESLARKVREVLG